MKPLNNFERTGDSRTSLGLGHWGRADKVVIVVKDVATRKRLDIKTFKKSEIPEGVFESFWCESHFMEYAQSILAPWKKERLMSLMTGFLL